MKKIKILFIGYNQKTGYSGGRYHALLMANALAETNYDVTYWTNNIPQFYDDFAVYHSQKLIKFDLSLRYKIFKKGDYDYIIVIPDMNPYSGLYEKALLTAYLSNAQLSLLNFESPNWFNKYSPVKRNEKLWSGWNSIAKYANIILSSTAESNQYAKEYYDVKSVCRFEYSYPCINSKIAEKINLKNLDKENEIIIITRFDKDSLHKGSNVIDKLFDSRLKGYTLKFIIGTSVDDEIKIKLSSLSKENGVSYKFLEKVNDYEKFIEIKKSKGMVFLSKFEGFGYPPVESLYVGTRCITYKLKVFEETCGECLDYCEYDNIDEVVHKLIDMKTNFKVIEDCQNQISDKVSFISFSNRLSCIFKTYNDTPLSEKINPYIVVFSLCKNQLSFLLKLLIKVK